MGGKSSLFLALGGGKPKGEPATEETEDMDLETSAAQDAMDAVKGNDVDGFKSALRRFVQSCQASYEADEPDEG